MKKRLILILLSFVLILALSSCVSTDKTAAPEATITIDCPSPTGSLIAAGRHFKVSGTLTGTVPEDAVLKVSLFDSTGKEVRYAEADHKGTEDVDLSWYDGPLFVIVPGTALEEVAYTAPELVVKEGRSPLDATTKAVYTDETFFALITCATSMKHGLTNVDYFSLVDEDGEPYTALPEGSYTITALLTTADGAIIASDSKDIQIGRSNGTVIHEITNADVNIRGGMGVLMGWAAPNGYTVLNDLLPGMFGPFYQLSTIAMSYGTEESEYVGNTIHTVLYGNHEVSTSNSLEIAQFVQRHHTADNPACTKYYTFSMGEPQIGGVMAEIIELDAPVQILRIDSVTDETENGVYLTSEEQILLSDTDSADGWTVEADSNFALMGVIQPYQLKDEEIVDDEDIYSYCVYLNNIASVDYVLTDASTKAVVDCGNKETGLKRNGDKRPSVYEFYLVFDKALTEEGKTYEMTLSAKDRNGEAIPERTLSFSFLAD